MKSTFTTSSFFSKKAKITIARLLSNLKFYLIVGFLFWLVWIFVIGSVVHELGLLGLLNWKGILAFLFTALMFNEAVGLPWNLLDYVQLKLDLKSKTKSRQQGQIESKTDNDYRHSIFRYELKLKGEAKSFVIDKKLFDLVKKGDNVELIFLQRIRIVCQYKLIDEIHENN